MPCLKRRISITLLRYISVGFLVPFFCSIIVFIALFLLKDVLDDVSDFIDKGVPFTQTALYYLAKQPSNLINVIPVAVLLGTCFLTMTLGRSNELTAMRAAGLSLATCALPIWVTAIVSCAAVFAINESWGNRCQQKSQAIYETTLEKKKEDGRINFSNAKDNRDWSIARIQENDTLSSVIVRQYDEHSNSLYLLVADKAEKRGEYWSFYDGFIQYYEADGLHLKRAQEFFSEKNMAFSENVQDLYHLHSKSETLNIRAMRQALNSPFITSVRSIRAMKVMIWHRLTVPLASLVAALFAFALTLSTERKGVMKGFALAVGLLVLFYVSGQLGLTLAKNAYISPFIGGAVPHLFFLFLSLYTMYKKQ